MKNKIEDLKAVIREFSGLSQELLFENNYLRNELDVLNERSRKAEEEKKEIRADHNLEKEHIREDHIREVETLNRKIRGLQTDINTLESAKSEWKSRYEKLLEDYGKKKRELREDKQDLSDKIEELTNERNYLKNKVDSLENQLNERDNINDKLEKIFSKIECDDSVAIQCIEKVNSLMDILNDRLTASEESQPEEDDDINENYALYYYLNEKSADTYTELCNRKEDSDNVDEEDKEDTEDNTENETVDDTDDEENKDFNDSDSAPADNGISSECESKKNSTDIGI